MVSVAEAGGEVVVEVDRVVDAGRPQGVALQVQQLGAVGQITMRSTSSTVTVSAVRS